MCASVNANERKMDCYLGQKSLKMEVHKQVFHHVYTRLQKVNAMMISIKWIGKAYINKIETKLAK